MEPNVLSYAGPRPVEPPPENPVTTVGLWIGGIGWGCVALTLLCSRIAGRAAVSGWIATIAVGLGDALGATGAVLAPSGVLLGITAIVVGPARRRAAVYLGIQLAAHVSILVALIVI